MNDAIIAQRREIVKQLIQAGAYDPALWDIGRSISETIKGAVSGVVEGIVERLKSVLRDIFSYPLSAIRSAISYIWEKISHLPGAIYSYFRNILEHISNAITWLKDRIVSSIDLLRSAFISAISGLATRIEGFIDKIRSVLGNIVSTIASSFSRLISYISSGLRELGSHIWNSIRTLGSNIYNTLYNIWSRIESFYGRIFSTLRDTIIEVSRSLWERIREGFAPVIFVLKKVWDTIKQIPTIIANGIRTIVDFYLQLPRKIIDVFRRIIGIAPTIFTTVVRSVEQGFMYFALGLGELLGMQMKAYGIPLMALFGSTGVTIAEGILIPALEMFGGVTPPVGPLRDIMSASAAIGLRLASVLRSIFELPPPVTFEKAFLAHARFVSLCFFFSMLPAMARFFEEIVDLISGISILGTGLGKGGGGGELGLSMLFRQFYWAIGLGWVSWLTLSPIITATVGDPLRQYYQAKYRTRNPTRGLLDEALRLKVIDWEKYYYWMAILGYHDELIQASYHTAWRYPTISMLIDMVDYGIIKWDELPTYVEKLGYPPEWTSALTYFLQRRLLDEYARKYRSRVIKRFARGRITYDEAFDLLVKSGMSEARAAWALEAARWELEEEIIDLHIKTIQEKFLDRTIDEDTARDLLSNYIVDPDLINAYINYWIAKRDPRLRVPPYETLRMKRLRLQTKVRSLEAQINSLIAQRKQHYDVYLARLRYYDQLIESIRERYEAMKNYIIKRLDAEFEYWKTKTVGVLRARVDYLKRRLDIRIKSKKDALERYITLRKGELEQRIRLQVEEIKDSFTELRLNLEKLKPKIPKEFLELYREVIELITKCEYYFDPELIDKTLDRIAELFFVTGIEVSKTIRKLIDRIEDRMVKIEVMVAMEELRLEERRARVEELITREQEEISAKIDMLTQIAAVAIPAREARYRAIKEARIEYLDKLVEDKVATYLARRRVIEEQMELTLKRYDARIEKLGIALELARNELEAVEELIKRYYPA